MEQTLVTQDINRLLEVFKEDESITSLFSKYRDIHLIKKLLEDKEANIKERLRIFLKEHNWNDYNDKESNCSIKIEIIKREDIDKAKLNIILTPSQIEQITKITTFEKMLIVTPELRATMKSNMKHYGKVK